MPVEAKLSKKFKCAECGFTYDSPIPVASVQHKCLKTVAPKTKRIGMVAQ